MRGNIPSRRTSSESVAGMSVACTPSVTLISICRQRSCEGHCGHPNHSSASSAVSKVFEGGTSNTLFRCSSEKTKSSLLDQAFGPQHAEEITMLFFEAGFLNFQEQVEFCEAMQYDPLLKKNRAHFSHCVRNSYRQQKKRQKNNTLDERASDLQVSFTSWPTCYRKVDPVRCGWTEDMTDAMQDLYLSVNMDESVKENIHDHVWHDLPRLIAREDSDDDDSTLGDEATEQ